MGNATFLLFITVLLPLQLFASYTFSPTQISLVDNTPNCATINCLVSIGGTSAEVKAGYDGTIYGLAAAGVLYTYTPANGWVEAPTALQTANGQIITHISVASSSQVLVLNSNNFPFVLNAAGTAWTALTQRAFYTAEIGADGTACGIGLQLSTWYCYDASTLTWAGQPGAPPQNLAIASAASIWGVNSSGALCQWSGTAWIALSPAPAFTPATTIDALSVMGENGLAVIDSIWGIHVSTTAGQTWSTITGTATGITGGGAALFTLAGQEAQPGIAGYATYHVNLVVPSISVTQSGTYNCNPPPPLETCPASTQHTLMVNTSFGGVGACMGRRELQPPLLALGKTS